MIIDTHCHAGKNWFEPVEMLIHQMKLNNVGKAVLIQHYGSGNNYLFDCLNSYPDKFSIVPIIKWGPEKFNQAEKIKKSGASGIRIYLNYEELFSDLGIQFCKFLGELGLVASVAGTLDQFSSEEFKKVVMKSENTNFIIEHLAGVSDYILSEDLDIELEGLARYDSVLELAKYKNVFIKVPGLGELNIRPKSLSNDSPFEFDNNNLIKKTLGSFGSDHMMWGSDFPPVSNREGYKNALEAVRRLEFLSDQDKKNIFELVPIKLFF